GERAFSPRRLFAHRRQYIDHAAGIESRFLTLRARRLHENPTLAQQRDAKLQRILAGCVRQFVDEGLEHEPQGIAARRAQRAGGYPERHQRSAELEIRHEFRGKLLRAQRRAVGELVPLAEGYEVVTEGRYFPLGIESGLEEMKSGGTIEVMPDIVLPIPQELHGRADLLGNPCRFDHVVVHEAPAEAAAATSHVDGDVRLIEAESFGDDLAARV